MENQKIDVILTIDQLKEIISVMPEGIMLELSWEDADGQTE